MVPVTNFNKTFICKNLKLNPQYIKVSLLMKIEITFQNSLNQFSSFRWFQRSNL